MINGGQPRRRPAVNSGAGLCAGGTTRQPSPRLFCPARRAWTGATHLLRQDRPADPQPCSIGGNASERDIYFSDCGFQIAFGVGTARPCQRQHLAHVGTAGRLKSVALIPCVKAGDKKRKSRPKRTVEEIRALMSHAKKFLETTVIFFATQSSQSQCYDAMATSAVDPGPASAPGPPSSAGLVAGACLPAAAAAPPSPGSQTRCMITSSNGRRRGWRAHQISGIIGLLLRAPTLSRIVIGEIRCS